MQRVAFVPRAASHEPENAFEAGPIGAGSCPPLGDRRGLGRSGASFFHFRSEISSPVWYSRFCIKITPKKRRMLMKCLKIGNTEKGTK